MSLHYWFLISKDVDRPIGGVKQIYRLAECISRIGYSVTVIQGSSDFSPSWFPLSINFSTISYSAFRSRDFDVSRDILIIPETFVPVFHSLPPIRKIIFNQNSSYTFGQNLDLDPAFVLSVYSSPLLSAVLCVSSYDYNFLVGSMRIEPSKVHLLANPIEKQLFYPQFPKKKQIVYMPRKNSSHSSVVTSLIRSSSLLDIHSWQFLPIRNMSLDQVASSLRDSVLFLSFGSS